MILRYASCDGRAVLHRHGDWCKYVDVAKLEARMVEREAENEELQELIASLKSRLTTLWEEYNKYKLQADAGWEAE